MKRRHFVEVIAAGAGLLALPSWVVAGVPAVKITRFRVGLPSDMAQLGSRVEVRDGREVVCRTYGPSPNPTPDRDNHYKAAVIEIGDRFWYRAKGVAIEVTEYEAKRVIGYPLLHYFTTALTLHYRIDRAIEGVLIPA